ncbi:MAG TPA: dihydrodipicolinate synthase family protein [Candidatus Limnocylindrales bacterium]|nr:dihydrodipicolinate synthase family protein [Candidatus Limnocylindrales bacterium]
MSAVLARPGGIVCPLATPWSPDGRLDEAVLRDLIDVLVPDLDGLFVLGSSGELAWLPDDVADRVARIAVDQVGGRIPVYVGAGDTGGRRTLDRVARLADVGADYVVLAAPFYYAVDSEAAIIDHFATVADAASAPIVLYNIPQNTHRPLTPGAVRALAVHPRIAGMKDSAGDWFAFEEFLAARSEGFSVMQGREQMAAISLWSGADGVISAVANLAPRLLRALAEALRAERPRAEVLALQATISDLAGVFAQGEWLAGLKGTLQILGWPVGDPGRPIPPLDPDGRAAVGRILATPAIARWLMGPRAGADDGMEADR